MPTWHRWNAPTTAPLYKTYMFCDLLYRLLPVNKQDKVDLNKQRKVQIETHKHEKARANLV